MERLEIFISGEEELKKEIEEDAANGYRVEVVIKHGGAAAWAGCDMRDQKFWLDGPQCIWPRQ